MNNFNRKVSASVPHDPPAISRPSLDTVPSKPSRFDNRYLAWRLVNPSHPQANDKNLTERGRWPRQQADESCNVLQLYEHIEYYLEDYQTRYGHYKDNEKVLILPYQFITPKPGWKLLDLDSNLEYEVRDVMTSLDINNTSTFDGRVLLTQEGPPLGHTLRWLDPNGVLDEEPKVIRIRHSDDIRPLIEARSSSGDNANVRGKYFVPTIGYSMIRHGPGSIDNNPFGPRRENKPRLRSTFRDPNNPDMVQKIHGQWMDTLLEFKVYALGGKIADRVGVWLRNFFMMYNGALMSLGVQQLMYWETIRDKEETRAVYDLSVRHIQYYFRIEELEVELNSKLASYNMLFGVSDFTEMDPWYTSEPAPATFPTDSSDTLPLYGLTKIADDY